MPDLNLPVTNPVLVFALAMATLLIAPLVAQRFNIPGIIGLIVAGAIIGPNALGLLARDNTIVLLGTVGLLYLMFLAGSEVDLNEMRRYKHRSIIFGTITFLVPQTLGIFVGLALGYPLPSAILLASMFASHTLVAYPIALRFGLARLPPVTTAVGGTIITDTSALLVLAVIAAGARGTLDAAFWVRLGISLAVYAAAVFLVLPRVARWFFRHGVGGATAEWVFVVVAIFLGASLAQFAGIEAIVGAFMVGLALNRLIPREGLLNNRLRFVGEALFVPFFLFSVGMLLDVRVVLGGFDVWKVLIGMSLAVTTTKFLAAALAGRIIGYSREEWMMMFGLSVPQAAATLAAVLVGYQLGLFDDAVLNGAILMILVTCMLGPWVVEKYGRILALREEQSTSLPSEVPQRILVPMANPATARGLMDLALLVRGENSPEPIRPLSVVPGEGEAALVHVVTAEKMLSHAVGYAAGAAAPAAPITRIDNNFAAGISRAVTETRSSLVIIGWDGTRTSRHVVFGSVLDQLLERTRRHLIVAKLSQPLNLTQRIVVAIPPGADHDPGFFETAGLIKMMANRLGAPILAAAVSGNPKVYQRHLETIRPAAKLEVEGVRDWRGLIQVLHSRTRPDDLVVVISARRGALSWHRELERLPSRLARLVAGSFLVVYPPEPDGFREAEGPFAGLPRALTSDRILLGMPRVPYEEALRRLLRTHFAQEPERTDEILRSLTSETATRLTEIVSGVALPHTRIPDLPEPLVFMATSREGIQVPLLSTPAHLLLILLSPLERPEEQLEQLAEIARMVSDPVRLHAIQNATTMEELRDALAPRDATV